MTRFVDFAPARPRLARRLAVLAVSAGLVLGCSTGLAFADHRGGRDFHHGDRHHGGWHHGGHWGGWGGGYYPPPPVVYGAPYYAPPPVVYGPGFGINVHIP